MGKSIPFNHDIQALISSVQGAEPLDLSPIEHGEWSTAYAYRLGEGNFIIRFSELDEDFRKDAFACRYASPALPIPRIIRIGEAFDGYYAISEKAQGVPIDTLNASRMKTVTPSVIDLLDALRQADVSDTRGYGGWSPEGEGSHASWKEYLLEIDQDPPVSRIHGWKEKLAQTSSGLTRFKNLYRQFAHNVSLCPEDRYLIHADLLHYNLLVADGKISAVIDWGCSKYGDFLYELAWFTFWSPWFPAMDGIDYKEAARWYYLDSGVDLPNFDERIKAYEFHIALDSISYCAFIDNWDQVEQVTRQAEGKVDVG